MVDRLEQQLGNYRLERLIAQGGFGDVYLGEHIHLGTQAAIKVLNTQIVHEDVGQFRTEARMIARLIHPHIVRILEYGVDGSTPFLVMDYAPNGTLRQLHPKGSQLPLTTIVSYVQQIAEALQYAHDNKLIHRDVKPENMLIGRHNELLLSDFGIALIVQSSRYQGTQDLAGTIGYMAPEQIQAHPLPSSDQYALGIVVYEWLCGDRPFHGSFTEIAAKHATAPPPSLREKMPKLSPDVEHVVMTALAKDPQKRFANVQAFATALEQASKEGLETVFSVKPGAQPSPQLIPTNPVNEIRPKEAEKAGSPGKVAETSPEDDESNGKHVTTVNTDRIVWTISIGKPRMVSLLPSLIGIILCGLLISLVDLHVFVPFFYLSVGRGTYYSGVYYDTYQRLFEVLGLLAIFGLVNVVPLFFGAAFGSIVGLLTGGIGCFVGTYGSFSIYYAYWFSQHGSASYFDFLNQNGLWYLILYMALIGFIAGLAASRTQRRYNTLHNLLIAYLFSLVGVMIGVSLILITFDFIVLQDGLAWQQVLLFVVTLPGLILLPILLRAYDPVVERIEHKRLHRAI